MIDPYTDPHELFDVCDASGHPTGQVKPRWEVHRDGDWHRSLHCWVLCETDEGPGLLLQRRGAQKDTYPSLLDASVGGHYKAGETLADVLREVEEEIGLAVGLEQLVWLGRRVGVGEQAVGVRDHEVQDVFLWRSGLPLEAFHPQPVEVTALEAATIADLLRLFGGDAEQVPVRVLRPDDEPRPSTISKGDFVPTVDQYFYRVAVVADLAVKGCPHLVI